MKTLDPNIVCRTPEQAFQMGANALARGHLTLARQCFWREGVLRADAAGLTGIEHTFEVGTVLWERMKHFRTHGWKVRANYIRRAARDKGVVAFLTGIMAQSGATISAQHAEWHVNMAEAGLMDWTDEAMIVRHRDQFDAATVAIAEARLAQM